MTQEQKNKVQESLFKTSAKELENSFIEPHRATLLVYKIRELALVNSQIAADAVPVLAKFSESTNHRIQSLSFASVRLDIDRMIKEISNHWDVMTPDVSCKPATDNTEVNKLRPKLGFPSPIY